MTQYFKKFPVINYDGSPAINLMARVNMSKLALAGLQTYYDYTITDNPRPDNLSYDYYGNPDYVWLISLANQIIDPYYDFPLTDDNLNQLIINKYGSVGYAQYRIEHFQTNWATDSSILSPTQFAALPNSHQKYWDPIVDYNNNIYEYVRKQETLIVSTNMVQQLQFSYSNQITTENGLVIDTESSYDLIAPEGVNYVPFVNGEVVLQNGYTVGTVVSANTSEMTIQHTSGQVVNNTAIFGAMSGPIVGWTSNATATVTSVATVSTNIPLDEYYYWSPVTSYDIETAKNTSNKNINLLDNRYAIQATQQLKDLLLV